MAIAKPGYNNSTRRATTSTTTLDPRAAIEDVDYQLNLLKPAVTPLLFLGKQIGKGAVPKSHKVQVMMSALYDPFDSCTLVKQGEDKDARLACIRVNNDSRPDVESVIFQPQDILRILETDQVVQVIITPDAAYKVNGSEVTVSTSITGNTTTRSAEGTIVVKVLNPVAFKSFTGTASIVNLGRTIWESQPIQAQGKRQDVVYDYNFVEHKEAVLEFSGDTYEWVKQKPGIKPEWSFQEEVTMANFQQEPELAAIWGERSESFDQTGRPMRTMRGLIDSIRTNVSYYNSTAITDFEGLVINFLHSQAFKYLNPKTDSKSKMAMCGRNFLQQFNLAFQSMRRNTNIAGNQSTIGMNFDRYLMPGGYNIVLTGTEAFRTGTPAQDWCAVIDPSLAQWKIVKDFKSRPYALPTDRDYKLMMEWQGTISWNLEQVNALLKTV